MCERLYAHIGDFRIEATEYFRKIVDNIHDEDKLRDQGIAPVELKTGDEDWLLLDE